jgi:FtsP/CotA-like multicopper oxidase with cupredoxin domain
LRKRLTYLFFLIAIAIHAQTTITYLCILRSNAQKDTLCDGRVLPIFGIASTLSGATKIPAKILYCNEGDSVVLNTKSISQGEHHTIHLHGLDVDTRNDGDPATSFWLSHQQDTTYSFKAKNAGTYLYHCHAADVVHVQMGMYGMIVVRAAGGVKTVWTGGPV